MVHTTHNKASLPYNCQLGKLRLMTDNGKDEFEAAADHTAEQLSEGWYEFIQSNVSSGNNKSPVCNAMSHNLKQWENSDQNTEMVNAGLDSSILSPFLMEAENNLSDTNRDLSPTDPVTLKSGKKFLDPNLKNEITRSILKINKRFIAHFNRRKKWISNFQEKLGKLQNIDLYEERKISTFSLIVQKN